MDPVKEQLHVPVSGIRKKAAPFLCQGPVPLPKLFRFFDERFPLYPLAALHDIKTPETALRGVCLLE